MERRCIYMDTIHTHVNTYIIIKFDQDRDLIKINRIAFGYDFILYIYSSM